MGYRWDYWPRWRRIIWSCGGYSNVPTSCWRTLRFSVERLRAVQTFYKAGLVNDMDVARQETLLHNTVGTLPVLTSTAKNLIHRLSVLLGETPASLESD